MDVVATAICLAHPIDVSDKDRAWHGGHPTANFKAANDAVFKGHGNGQRASGAACDIGAAVVVRYSGVDKNFPGGLGAGMIPLAKDGGNKKWDVIKTSSLDDFQPGDVALREGHVWVYIGKIGNKHYGVQSHMKRKYNGKAGAYLAVEESSDERVTWALRPKNAKEQQTVITEEMLKNAGTSNSLKASSSTTNSTETSTETSTTTGESARGTGNIAAAALELGWPKGTAKSKYKVNRSTKEGNWTPAGRKYFDEITKKKYKYGTSNDGASCSIYATTVLKYAGVIDTEKVHRSPSWIQKQLPKDTENWEEVKIEKVSDYQSGDVLIRPGNVKGHAAIYVEVDGKGYLPVENAVKIGVDDLCPLLCGHLMEHAVTGNSGVVHQNIYTPEALHDLLSGGFHLLVFGDIALDGHGLFAQTLRHTASGLIVIVHDGNALDVLTIKNAGSGLTNTGACSGNNSNFIFQHKDSSPLISFL